MRALLHVDGVKDVYLLASMGKELILFIIGEAVGKSCSTSLLVEGSD